MKEEEPTEKGYEQMKADVAKFKDEVSLSSSNALLWLDAPTLPGWYWMKCQLSSKPAIIKQVHYFAPHFVIDTSPLKDWENWKFCGPLQEP